jgi:transposase InsO family protein
LLGCQAALSGASNRSRDNPLWGRERIRGELLKLGIVASKRSVRRYRWRPPLRPGQTRRTFLRIHARTTWAVDLFTAQTLAFRTPHVLLLITRRRREPVDVHVTAHSTAAWGWRQVVEATAWGRRPRHLVRDRDAVYGSDFAVRAAGPGIETVLTPVRARRANASAERVVRTLRNDCLDHVIPLIEAHLHAVLAEYVRYDNAERPHRSLGLESPLPPAPTTRGPVRAQPVLGGLHHVYRRAA